MLSIAGLRKKVEEGLTVSQLAEHFNCSKTVIYDRLHSEGLKARCVMGRGLIRPDLDRPLIIAQRNSGMTLKAIADIHKTSKVTISNICKRK